MVQISIVRGDRHHVCQHDAFVVHEDNGLSRVFVNPIDIGGKLDGVTEDALRMAWHGVARPKADDPGAMRAYREAQLNLAREILGNWRAVTPSRAQVSVSPLIA